MSNDQHAHDLEVVSDGLGMVVEINPRSPVMTPDSSILDFQGFGCS
jgi:hypothetical protein